MFVLRMSFRELGLPVPTAKQFDWVCQPNVLAIFGKAKLFTTRNLIKHEQQVETEDER